MKKLLLLLLVLPFIFGSCSSDDDNEDNPKVSSIKIESIESDLFIRGEYQLKVTHTPSTLDAPAYTWESSNTEVATVDNNGKLKTIKEGQAIIKVTATSLNLTSNLNITVLPIQATSIKLDKQTHEIVAGQSFTLTCKIEPDNTTNKNVTWTSSDETIATVSKEGVVTALSDGDITVTASLGSLKDECKIKVTPIKVSGIILGEFDEEIEALESFQLTATVEPYNAKNKNVTWKSSNENVATVDNAGKVSTKKEGDASITVMSEDGGFTASISVSVYSFTKKITVSPFKSMVSTPWESYTAVGGKLQNNSKKTIIAKKITIYENGIFLSSQDINNTLTPGADVSYSIKRDGNFKFIYEYEFNGATYSTI